ncbi:MAG TPA: glycosyltransferase [Ktedonobacterales bacterium]
MRIAIITGVFPKVSETFVLRHISALLGRGHEVDIYSDYHPRDDEFPPRDPLAAEMGARTIYMDVPPLLSGQRLASAPLRLIRSVRVAPQLTAAALNPREYGWQAVSLSQMNRLYTLARTRRRYDIIHAHFGMIGDRFRFTSALWDAPLAVSFHGFDYSEWPLAHGPNCYVRLFGIAARIVANSENTRRRVELLGCPPDKMVRIAPYWNMAGFTNEPRIRTEGEPFRALTVARLIDIKGLDDSITAIALAQRARPDLDLRYDIVGAGPLRADLESLIHRLGLGDRVTLHGARNSATVSALMARAHVFLLASRTTATGAEEGFGVTLLEAQAAGLPVVATRHGAFPEVVRDGETGFLAPERAPDALAASLGALIDHPAQARQMGTAGRRRVEEYFAPDMITDAYEALYEDMASARRRSYSLASALPITSTVSDHAQAGAQTAPAVGARPLHIALLSRSIITHHFGGMETHGESLRRALVEAGHRVTTLTTALPSGPAVVRDEWGSIYYLAGGKSGAYSRAWNETLTRTLLDLHDKDAFDIVASQSAAAFPYIEMRGRLAPSQRIPTVVMTHGAVLAALPGHLKEMRYHPAQVLLRRLPEDALNWENFRRGLPGADHITVLSEADGADIRRWFPVPAHNITVIPNGVDTVAFSPSSAARAEARERLGLGSDESVIGILASLEPRKGQHVMLDALATPALRAAQDLRPVRLALIGDGPSRAALRARAERLGLADRVVYAGPVAHDQAPALLNAMDIVALPSLAEGMPLALLEAMACGKAIVASDVGAISDVLVDGVNGLLVPPAAPQALARALDTLIGDPNYASALGARARLDTAPRYDVSRSTSRYDAVFRQVAAQKV